MVPPALSRRHSTRRRIATFSLITALLVTGCSTPVTPGPDETVLPASADQPGHVVEGALLGRTGAGLVVATASSRVLVQTAGLPGLLYRITTPAGSGLAPRVTGAPGQVRLTLLPTGDDGPDDVTIVLNQAVRWDLRLPAGAGEQHLDLSHGRITRLELGAAGLVTANLPRPHGTVPVTFAEATGTVRIATPPGTAVRLRLRKGAGRVSVPWTATAGAPRTGILASLGWPSTADRYTIDARATVETLTLR
jgi:hypothetical protein